MHQQSKKQGDPQPQLQGTGGHRAPPSRVMEDRKQRDAAQSNRRLESEIERVANARFQLSKKAETDAANKSFEEADRSRHVVTVDPGAVAMLNRLGLAGPLPAHAQRESSDEWKSPIKHNRGPDATERKGFLKSLGLPAEVKAKRDADPTPLDSSLFSTPVKSTGPFHALAQSQGGEQRHRLGLASPSAEQHRKPLHHSAPTSPAPVGITKGPPTLDNTRAPLRTMVGHLKTVRTMMSTRALAPLPQKPGLADTHVPEQGSDVPTDNMLSKFKTLQAEERDFVTDVRSRQIAEEQEGTLLHFEMTQSIRRVEEIVAALERGKEFRDMAAYKQAKEEAEKSDTANQAAHEEASLDELRQVIQILLKDSSRQTTAYQKLELEARRTAQDLRDAQDLLTIRAQEVSELKHQLDELVRARETLKRDHAMLEQQHESLMARTRGSIMASSVLGDEASSSSDEGPATPNDSSFLFPQVHPSNGSILVPASITSKKRGGSRKNKDKGATFARLPVDGATMLKELQVANMLPSLASVPNGDDVTIVCTAVQAISQLWEHCGQDMPTAISLHNRILLEAIPKHKGYQVKTAGEEFMVAFHSTTAAINFAMTVQEQLAMEVWPQKLAEQQCCAVVRKEAPQIESPTATTPAAPLGDLWRGLRVCMGIHYGSVHVEINPITNGYDYMGQTVNRALMLKRISHGGMAAVSKEVYERLNQELMYEEDGDGSAHRRSGISYAETLRRKTSLKDLKSMRRQPNSPAEPAPPLCPITMAFHCKIPAARVAAQDVYCVLPMSLEDRLADIQASNRAMAAKHGIDFDDVLQSTQEDEQPSELENMLGTFSRQQGKQALFLTAEGVVDANAIHSEEEIEEIAIQRAGLPSGSVALLSVQCEAVRNKKFLEKILAKDMELLIRKFRDCVELATSPFGGHIIDSRGDIHTIAFQSIGVATRCALAIDAELTMTEWPKWIDNYKDTEHVRWYKNTTLYAGLRASIGLHVAHLEPHYDPMTKHVGYIGADAYVAFRLSCIARPGQTLIEESVAYQAIGLIKPLPLFTHLVPNASNANAVAARLCVVMSRCFVGRHFMWGGLETYEQCKSSQYKSQYKRMRMSIEMEDVRWRRDATRVVAKQHVSGGITAPAKGPASPTTAAEGDDADQNAESTGAETLLGLGEKFETIVQKADGTITAAMEIRQRDMDVINIFCTTLLDKLNSEHLPEALRDREPIINQLEKLEHNLMVMHDVFYEGQLVAFQPFIADIGDIRELPLRGTSRDAAEAAAAAAASASRKSTADEWTDAEDDDDNGQGFNEDEDDDTSAAIAAVSQVGAGTGKVDWLPASKGGSATEDDLRRRLVVLEEEVLLSHKILRNMLDVLKDWMEPLLGTHIRYIMPDDEVVSKLIAIDRGVREPYLKQQEAAAGASAQLAQGGASGGTGAQSAGAGGSSSVPSATLAKAIPKTTRQVWRQIVEHAVTDAGLEERLRGRGSKLLKSMESLVCRHFLFLRQYVKRVRIKERLTK